MENDPDLLSVYRRLKALEAKQAATETVLIHLIGPFLSMYSDDLASKLLLEMRTGFNVRATSAQGNHDETSKLICEEHINDLIDRIETLHRRPRSEGA